MRRIILLFIFITPPIWAWSQHTDYRTEIGIDYSHKLAKGFGIGFGQEVRLDPLGQQLSKSETTVGLEYALFRKPLKHYGVKLKSFGEYALIDRLNSHHRYEIQNRVNIGLSASMNQGTWQFGLRTRLQTTWRNEQRGSYRYNPQMHLRIRFKASFSPAGSRWEYYSSEELFYRVNDPEGRFVDECRTTVGITYKTQRRNEVGLYIKASHEVQVNRPDKYYALGFSYSFD